ncbi:hypothetical protein TNCV_815251 [Trichonephila clavipes]|nr:hypothetical protein TNCV_815251 [Trichonephila clavipes]
MTFAAAWTLSSEIMAVSNHVAASGIKMVAFMFNGIVVKAHWQQAFVIVILTHYLAGWKMEHSEEDQIQSSIDHIKNLTLLTSSKYNELNGQVTLSE